MPCTHRRCPVRDARWYVSADVHRPYGDRWFMARLAYQTGLCKHHARLHARAFNGEEERTLAGIRADRHDEILQKLTNNRRLTSHQEAL
jgi:hypothetical protein